MKASYFQPSLSPYYGNLTTNTDEAIQVKLPFYTTVGKGHFLTLSANEVCFSGHFSVLGHSGNLTLDMRVTGKNVGEINLNGHLYPCTFKVVDDQLIIGINEGDGPTTLQIQWWHGGLWIGGPGTPHDVWIGQV